MKIKATFALMGALLLTSATFLASASFNGDGIDDASGSRIVGLPNGGGSTANNVVIKNAASGAAPAVTVEGSDANPSIAIRAKGVGNVLIQGSSGRNIAAFEDAGGAHEYATFTAGVVGGGARLRADSAVSTDVDLRLDGQGRGRVLLNGEEPLTRSWTTVVANPVVGGKYTMAISDAQLVPTEVSSFALGSGGSSITINIRHAFNRFGPGMLLNAGGPYGIPAIGTSFSFAGPAAVIADNETVWIEVVSIAGSVSELTVALDTLIP